MDASKEIKGFFDQLAAVRKIEQEFNASLKAVSNEIEAKEQKEVLDIGETVRYGKFWITGDDAQRYTTDPKYKHVWYIDGYDGAEDGDVNQAVGYAATVGECQYQIDTETCHVCGTSAVEMDGTDGDQRSICDDCASEKDLIMCEGHGMYQSYEDFNDDENCVDWHVMQADLYQDMASGR